MPVYGGSTVFVQDSFDDRATTNGWGTPTIGPAATPWTVFPPTDASLWSIDDPNDRGQVALTSGNSDSWIWLPPVDGGGFNYTDYQTTFTVLYTSGTANFQKARAIFRTPDIYTSYFVGLKLIPGPVNFLYLEVGRSYLDSFGVQQEQILDNYLLAGAPATNTSYSIKFYVYNTFPTAILAKAWKTSDPEPTDWQVSVNDSTGELQNRNGFGFYFSSNGTNQTWQVPDITISSLNVALTKYKQQRISSLLKKPNNVKTHSLDALTRVDITSIDYALAQDDIVYDSKVLMYFSNNRLHKPTVTSTEDSVQNSDTLIDGIYVPSMKFAFSDYGSTLDDGYRLLHSSDDTLEQVPYIGTLSSYNGDVQEIITVLYDVRHLTNVIVIGLDPFVINDLNRVGQIDNISVEVLLRPDPRLGGVWTTIASFVDPGPVALFELWLQNEDGVTWNRTYNNQFSTYLQGVRVTIKHVITTGTEKRYVNLYEIDAGLEIDISDDILSWNIKKTRDTSHISLSPIGLSSADNLTLTLQNWDNKYNNFSSDSIYEGQLINNTKFKVSLGVKLGDDTFSYVPQGTFYADSWDISEDTSQVTIEATDFSKFLILDTAPPIFYENITMPEVIRDIIERAGVSSYNIEDTLITTDKLAIGTAIDLGLDGQSEGSAIIPNIVWNKDGKFWEFLQQLATSDLGIFYFDENEVFIYRTKESVDNTGTQFVLEGQIDENTNLLSADHSTELLANSITLDYSVPRMGDNPSSLWEAPSPVVLSTTGLSANIDADDTEIDVGDIKDWINLGYFKIDDEIIKYNTKPQTGVDADGDPIYTKFADCERGALDTTPAAHSIKTVFESTQAENGNVVQWVTNGLSGTTYQILGGVLQISHTNTTQYGLAWWPVDHPINYKYSGQFKVFAAPWEVRIPFLIMPGKEVLNHLFFRIFCSPDPSGDPDLGEIVTYNYELYRVYNGVVKRETKQIGPQIYANQWHSFELTVNNFVFSLTVDGQVIWDDHHDTVLDSSGANYDPVEAADFMGISFIGVTAVNYGTSPPSSQPGTEWDNLVWQSLGSNSGGNKIWLSEGFGSSLYEIRDFNMVYPNSPAKNINYYMTETAEAEVISFNSDPFTADLFVQNLVDKLVLISGARPEADLEGLSEYINVTGNAVELEVGETLSVFDTDSIRLYDNNEINISLPWIESRSHAQDLLNYLLEIYRIPTSFLNSKVIADPRYKLGQLMEVNYSRLGLSSALYWITQIEIGYQYNTADMALVLRSKAVASLPE